MKIFQLTILIFLVSSNLFANTKFFNEGLILYEKKEFEKAKFKFEQNLVFNPKSENTYLYLSKIFSYQKNKKLEEQNLNTVILLNPKNEEAIYNLAELKLKNSDYKKSKELIEQVLIFCESFCQKSKKLKVEIDKSIKK